MDFTRLPKIFKTLAEGSNSRNGESYNDITYLTFRSTARFSTDGRGGLIKADYLKLLGVALSQWADSYLRIRLVGNAFNPDGVMDILRAIQELPADEDAYWATTSRPRDYFHPGFTFESSLPNYSVADGFAVAFWRTWNHLVCNWWNADLPNVIELPQCTGRFRVARSMRVARATNAPAGGPVSYVNINAAGVITNCLIQNRMSHLTAQLGYRTTNAGPFRPVEESTWIPNNGLIQLAPLVGGFYGAFIVELDQQRNIPQDDQGGLAPGGSLGRRTRFNWDDIGTSLANGDGDVRAIVREFITQTRCLNIPGNFGAPEFSTALQNLAFFDIVNDEGAAALNRIFDLACKIRIF